MHFFVFSSVLFIFVAAFLFIAGYNNLEVAEYLLEHGADVNAQDKGGLIPLHNAASYGVGTPVISFGKPWIISVLSLECLLNEK